MGQGDRFLAPVIQLITFDEMGHCTRPRVLPKKLRSETTKEIINTQNQVINIQQLQTLVAENKVEKSKTTLASGIKQRHEFVQERRFSSRNCLPSVHLLP